MDMATAARLTATDWTDAGLRHLARDGFATLKADGLARTLGVSRGSFYWHFADVAAFHRAVLARWRERAVDGVVAALDGPPEQRLRLLIERAFGADIRLERALRAWAQASAEVAAAVAAVDRERVAILAGMIGGLGVAGAEARLRAQVLYWSYLGRVVDGRALTKAEVAALGKELMRRAV
jgi:AcrR family transcriptional regulator